MVLDATTHECRKFTYGGCRGNANRFNSKDLCQKQCQPMPFHKLEQQKVSSQEVCSLALKPDPAKVWRSGSFSTLLLAIANHSTMAVVKQC
uniref:BPTI/Kunitz inhibitor domain-containing protein n=1 Tax=Ditylenchus dipsaci TaxID=166011 RepID=A0A915E0C0_9BILA